MVVIYFFFPETKGLGLEEMAQIFGEDITDLTMDADNAIIEPRDHDLKSKVDHIESVSPQNSANVKLSN